MNKNFTQPFISSTSISVSLLVEVEADCFLQFTETDELGAFYTKTLHIEMVSSEDITLQLVKFLHENCLELVKYRELIRETYANYSYVDDTPGESETIVCLHVEAERTNLPVPHSSEESINFLSLMDFLTNLHLSGMPHGVIELGVIRLCNERAILMEDDR